MPHKNEPRKPAKKGGFRGSVILLIIIQIDTPTATSFIFQKLATNPPWELPNHEELGSKTVIITRIHQPEMPILGGSNLLHTLLRPMFFNELRKLRWTHVGGPLQPKVLGCSSQGLDLTEKFMAAYAVFWV